MRKRAKALVEMIFLANLLKKGLAIKGVMVDQVESIGYEVISYFLCLLTLYSSSSWNSIHINALCTAKLTRPKHYQQIRHRHPINVFMKMYARMVKKSHNLWEQLYQCILLQSLSTCSLAQMTHEHYKNTTHRKM